MVICSLTLGGSFTSPSLTGGQLIFFIPCRYMEILLNQVVLLILDKASAGTHLRAINTTFFGNYNSTINSWNIFITQIMILIVITINKSNGAKVICASDVVI